MSMITTNERLLMVSEFESIDGDVKIELTSRKLIEENSYKSELRLIHGETTCTLQWSIHSSLEQTRDDCLGTFKEFRDSLNTIDI